MVDPLETVRAEITAISADLESKRQRYWQIFIMAAPMAFAIICAIAAMNTDHGNFPWPIVGLMTFVAVTGGFQLFNLVYRSQTKKAFIGKIAAALGMRYEQHGLFAANEIDHHQILPNYDIQRVEDGFIGTINGVTLSFEEIALAERYQIENPQTRRLEYQERATFWGLVVRINIGKTLKAHTIVIPRSRVQSFFRTTLSKYKPVNLVSSKFEDKFDTIGTDQVEARYVLDPAFMERFLEASNLTGTKWLSASFQGQEIAIAFQRAKPMFEIKGLWKPVTEKNLETVIAELIIILKMIETLKLNPYTGLGSSNIHKI